MPNSLRTKLSKLRYKRQISDEEYRELTEKLNGHDKELLAKIRAEILKERECAYADFERYKVEYLGQDWEDALDSLPQDDFRYGMERAIELIDKYMAESEG